MDNENTNISDDGSDPLLGKACLMEMSIPRLYAFPICLLHREAAVANDSINYFTTQLLQALPRHNAATNRA
jgi:hypothetical protein